MSGTITAIDKCIHDCQQFGRTFADDARIEYRQLQSRLALAEANALALSGLVLNLYDAEHKGTWAYEHPTDLVKLARTVAAGSTAALDKVVAERVAEVMKK